MEAADIMREGVSVAIMLSAPVLLLSMLVGILVAIFQAVTQIHSEADRGGAGPPGGGRLDDGDSAGLRPVSLYADVGAQTWSVK